MVANSQSDESVAADIAVLGLNQPRLRAGRRAVIEAIQAWASTKAGTRTRRQLEERAEQFDTPDANGRLESYVGVTVAWLHKHARIRSK